MSPHGELPAEVVRILELVLAGHCEWMMSKAFDADGREKRMWTRPGSGELVGLVERADFHLSQEVRLGPGRPKIKRSIVDYLGCLWVRTDSKAAAARLARFRPEPSVVLREGVSSRFWALWWLDRLWNADVILRANERISYNVGAPRKGASPDELWVPAPGSCLRVGRTRPAPVAVVSAPGHLWKIQQVTKRLKDAPDRNAWRDLPAVREA